MLWMNTLNGIRNATKLRLTYMQTCFLAQIVSTGGAAQLVKGYGLDMEKPQLPENHAYILPSPEIY